MLYLLGGASRAGKSKLARRLLVARQVPYLPIDILMMGIANGLPVAGIDPDAAEVVIGERLWPVVRAMAVNVLEESYDFLFEGAALQPRHAAELHQAWGEAVRICFIGYTSADPVRKRREIRGFGGEANDWVRQHTDAQLDGLITEMLAYSRFLKEECRQYSLPYVDGSADFLDALDRAFAILTAP